MALAIHFDEMIRAGKVANISEIARLTHVTQPRITQLMNLCHLATDIQEEILFLPLVMSGRDPVHEHMLRRACVMDWIEQRRRWGSLPPPLTTTSSCCRSDPCHRSPSWA
ncbi:MAG: hypothetical protein IPM13_16725 [Phycisphaerales bacterium]|nr:hypothetical protein [Phycisphaerales bacterium]